MDKYYGVKSERTKETDWLGSEIIIPRAPDGTQSFSKNGSIQYAQKDVSPVSCTLHGALGAYSDLTGYKFTLEQRKALWDEAVLLGANPDVGWYINSAVDLVRKYVNNNLDTKVSSYRVDIGSFEFGLALRMGYSVILGYRGNALYNQDKLDGVLDSTEFTDTTYGHCIRVAYSVGDEYDLMVDNYPLGKTNLYRISTSHWKELVKNRVFFTTGYIYLLK